MQWGFFSKSGTAIFKTKVSFHTELIFCGMELPHCLYYLPPSFTPLSLPLRSLLPCPKHDGVISRWYAFVDAQHMGKTYANVELKIQHLKILFLFILYSLSSQDRRAMHGLNWSYWSRFKYGRKLLLFLLGTLKGMEFLCCQEWMKVN